MREAWYEARLKEGVQVVVCHPKLVETGLDLLDFPTLYFYETGYSLFTLRQASRRSWRIGQKHPVRVKFLMYSGTVQENQLRLMGKKLCSALMLEGKMSGEGLEGFEEDDDMVTSMVRELLDTGKVGESADAVWANLARERAQMFTQAPALVTEERKSKPPTATSHSTSPALLRSTPPRRKKSQKLKRLNRCQRRQSRSWSHRHLSLYLNQHQHPRRKRTFLRSMRCVPKSPAASQWWRMRSRCCCSADSADSKTKRHTT